MNGEEITRRLDGLLRAGAGRRLSDPEFDELARAVFAEQFEGCAPYRRYCERRRRTPRTVGHWTEVPAVPARVFKELELISHPGPIERVFETSGTTATTPGRHLLPASAVELYRLSMRTPFRHFLLPELEEGGQAPGEPESGPKTLLSPVVLGPSAEDAPRSSLYFMIDELCRSFFHEPPRHVLGSEGLDGKALLAALSEAERTGRPVFLFGTALAFDAACEWLERGGLRFFLPSGSRALETGGTKGRSTALAPARLRSRIAGLFGIEEAAVVGEYGMTEACSQFYEDSLRTAEATCEPEEGERLFFGPPWARALVCDPETLEPTPAGRMGVVRLVDLANRFTLSFLLTEDLAVSPRESETGPGSAPFVLRGRARGAEARGCSLAAEKWVRLAGESR